MSLRVKKKLYLSVLFILPLIIVASGCFLYPPEIRYNSYLVASVDEKDASRSIDSENGSVICDIGGSSVVVRSMPEVELNALFPDESKNDKYSTNPYTYGNWIDPDLGYTPMRFTVFSV